MSSGDGRRFLALIENSSDVLMLINRAGNITYITPSSRRHLGWPPSEMIDRSLLGFVHPDDRGLAEARMSEMLQHPGEAMRADVRFKHADLTWRSMEAIGVNRLEEPSVGAIIITARDITERQKLEAQLRQAQKMEAVGRLAGGVAHDFNNLLTTILGYCNLMLDEMPAEDPLRKDLDEIRLAGERAAALTRQLLAFSRRQMLQPQTIDLNALVRQMEKMLQRLVGEDVEVATTLAEPPTPVVVDPSSIEQVLVTLAVNARDAMPAGGRLTVETAIVDLAAAYADSHAAVIPGRYGMLAVTDTGEGMDAATRARIFEPFFTTKEQGRGVGLGLATVYGIVKQSGGYIWIDSEPGRGTSFKIYFPEAAEPPATTTAAAAGVARSGGSETVLLVEDEDAVRGVACQVLRRHGYIVLEARHGLDALRISERHQDAIQLLITDLEMPEMSGRELAQRLAAARSNIKILFISGYTDPAGVHRDLTPSSTLLAKPFTPASLIRAVRGILDGEVDAPARLS